MRLAIPALFITIWHLPLSLLSQVVVGRPWTLECGVSTIAALGNTRSFNFRYISPRFKWSDYELSEEEEKQSEKFRNTRLMVEFIYAPPARVFCMGFNAQSRLLRYRKLSFEVIGGLKFFVLPGSDFVAITPLKAGREMWYMNIGVLCQLDLWMLAPFAEIGGDRIITVGTELNFHKIYRKPKRRYNLRTKTGQDPGPEQKPKSRPRR